MPYFHAAERARLRGTPRKVLPAMLCLNTDPGRVPPAAEEVKGPDSDLRPSNRSTLDSPVSVPLLR